jgi:hypothetical protein
MKNLCLVILLSTVVFSCDSLTKQDSTLSKQDSTYVGKWQFCYTDDSLEWNSTPRTFWDLKTIGILNLRDNRTWDLGDNSGQWGGASEFNNNFKSEKYYLGFKFKDDKFIAYNVDVIKNIEAHAIKIENTDVIELTINYSYKDVGIINDPEKGAIQVPNMEYHLSVHYYFIRDKNDQPKILSHFVNNIVSENKSENSPSNIEQESQPLDEQINSENTSNSFTVLVDKAFFYKESNFKFKRKAYLIKGQNGEFSKKENDFVFAKYTNDDGVETKGWISVNDIEISE